MAAKTILIVDDEQLTIQMLEDLLSGEGYQTLNAKHGAAALALLETDRPDLILTDIRMPVLDGLELCRRVLANPATATIPLILMTAMSDMIGKVDFPFAGFLLKPFQIEALLSQIAALVGSATPYE